MALDIRNGGLDGQKYQDILPDCMDELGITYDEAVLREIERRNYDAPLSRLDRFIRIPEFEQIVRAVVENVPDALAD